MLEPKCRGRIFYSKIMEGFKNPYPLRNSPLVKIDTLEDRQRERYQKQKRAAKTIPDSEKYFYDQAENILAIARSHTDREAVLKIIARNLRSIYGIAESNTKAICANEAIVKIEETISESGNLVIVTTVDKDSIYGAGL